MAAADLNMDFIILAAGQSRRFSADMPSPGPAKQFRLLSGKLVLLHSLDAIGCWPHCGRIMVVLPEEGVDELFTNQLKEAARSCPVPVQFTTGGATRTASTLNGLRALAEREHSTSVAVHDAARPFVPHHVLDALLAARKAGADGAVPALPITDTVKQVDREQIILSTIDRTSLRRVQTPQAFAFDTLLRLHEAFAGGDSHAKVTDDASLAEIAGMKLICVDGASELEKITFAEDLNMMQNSQQTETRTASGFDVHKFSPDESGPIMICGVAVDHDQGLIAHSDGDVGLHALCDAVLGCLAMGDIGQHFPPSDPKWKAASSDQFLRFALDQVTEAGGHVTLLDVTLICERPKIGPHRQEMTDRLSQITGLPASRLSVKATTSERLGFTGRGEGIAALAQATVCLPSSYTGAKG